MKDKGGGDLNIVGISFFTQKMAGGFQMDSIYLEYKGKKGDVTRYTTTIDTKQTLTEKGKTTESATKIQVVMSQTITDVAPDGILTVDVSIDSGKVTNGTQSYPLPNTGQKITMKMKKTGDIIYTSTPVDFSQPSFPEGPKQKKDRWTSVSKINVQGRPEPVELNYKYILWDIGKMNGMDYAEIKVSCPETATELQPGMTQKISATGSTLFEHRKGFLLKSEVETKTIVEVPENDVLVSTRVGVKVDLIR